ncbi:GNAT family N-acetyltransferase [Sphingomonas sabuli]|uniref:GNAT family N-acetyltransferase n=1 Tax=Sphingomonas sabuli TaxID=2764186 RepID=A0A7G9L040_9SPHN|nr:GNAT family N-acetyltransferase [Sphingomonas sabuli]QNM81989.1 GNAT family N-acetyltransferase [Sphingomonas sabuli]
MFARTPRLLLRPGFPEDAAALAAAIADERIVRNLATAPWPYARRDAEAFLAAPRDPILPSFLIIERTGGAPRLVGSCGLGRRPSGAVELGYWIARAHWGRGFATEAATAVIDVARALGLTSLEASHFLDNPASGRVLEKLGFMPTGIVAPRASCARAEDTPARFLSLQLEGCADLPGPEGEVLAA